MGGLEGWVWLGSAWISGATRRAERLTPSLWKSRFAKVRWAPRWPRLQRSAAESDSGVECGHSMLKGWVRYVGALQTLLGLAFTGYAVYLVVKAPTPFTYVCIAVGSLMLACGLLGCLVVGRGSKGLLRFYLALLLLVLVGHALFLIFCTFEREKTLDWVQNKSDNDQQVGRPRQFVEKHIRPLGYAMAVIVGIEAVTLLLACCCQERIVERDDEEVEGYRRTPVDDEPLLTSSSTMRRTESTTPQTDAQRDRMNQKYGNIFNKQQPTTRRIDNVTEI